jgi:hypothetical protein
VRLPCVLVYVPASADSWLEGKGELGQPVVSVLAGVWVMVAEWLAHEIRGLVEQICRLQAILHQLQGLEGHARVKIAVDTH